MTMTKKKKKKKLTSSFLVPPSCTLITMDIRASINSRSPHGAAIQGAASSSQQQQSPPPPPPPQQLSTRSVRGTAPKIPLVNPFQDSNFLDSSLTVGDSVKVLEAVHSMLLSVLEVNEARFKELRTKEDAIKDLLLPMLSFGEGSPYNEDANKVAKAFLAGFKFFPTEEELMLAAPEKFGPLLEAESCKGKYKGYVSDPSEIERRRKTTKNTSTLNR